MVNPCVSGELTIAPELDGTLAAIDVLVEASVVVAIGHTEADLELAQRSFDRGAGVFIHGFNDMEGIHHRALGHTSAEGGT